MAATIQVKVTVDKSDLNKVIAELNSKTVEVKASVTGNGKLEKMAKNLQNIRENGNVQVSVKADTAGAMAGVEGLEKKAKTLGERFTEAEAKLGRFLKTMASTYAIYGIMNGIHHAFSEALDTMKAVDTQLTNVAKVSGQTTQDLKALADSAYEVASAYGITADKYMESVYEFTKAGYQETNQQMAELAIKTQLVGDTTASVADKFLIVADTAWKYGGNIEQLSLLVDKADYINNNYATSLDKLADAFPRVASVAAMAGMSAEETMAMIGTITASTQETASRAGTAARALILNILKDTTTEVEEGLTLSEQQVEEFGGVLGEVLNKYGSDAAKAAHAAGKLLDPIEAISALSKAAKDNFLTESQLYIIQQSLGGKLRTNQLNALLENFDSLYTSMMTGMVTAAGTADKEIETMLSSWEAKVNILKNTWTEFVQASFNTDFIKGFVDGITTLLNLFGNLNNMLITISGVILGLKLPALAEKFNLIGSAIEKTSTKVIDFATGLEKSSASAQTANAALSGLQLTIFALTAAFTAYTMIYNSHIDGLKDSIKDSETEIKNVKGQSDAIKELYDTYVQANTAYENGTGSKEALAAATDALTQALGAESTAAEMAKTSIDSLTEAELQGMTRKAEFEIKSIEKDIEGLVKGYGWSLNQASPEAQFRRLASAFGFSDFGKTTEENIQAIDNTIQYLESIIETVEQKGASATDKEVKAAKQAREYLGAVEEEYGKLISAKEYLSELQGFDVEEMSDAAEATAGLVSDTNEAEEAFHGLAAAVHKATDALAEYDEAVKKQQGSAFTQYASAYEKFLTDWEKGLKGSTNVKAAEQLFFSDEQLATFWKHKIDVGEVLASDFYQKMFTYMDEEGVRQFTKGEDMGSNFLFNLFDNYAQTFEDGSKGMLDANGELAASFQETDDGLKLVVEDIDAFAEAIDIATGAGINAEVLAAILDALGVWSPELEDTARGLEDVAAGYGAVISAADEANGKVAEINVFKTLSEAAKDGGVQYALDLADALTKAAEAGDISIGVDLQGGETAKEYIEKIVDMISQEDYWDTKVYVEDEGAAETKTKVEETTEATEQLKEESPVAVTVEPQGVSETLTEIYRVTDAMRALDGKTATVSINTTGTRTSQIQGFFAEGTTNATGGLSLVNEEGPEIIQEGGTARIAGGGEPTLTVLQKGATVFTADDTRKILNGRGIELLTGGIPAHAIGNPPHPAVISGVNRVDASFYSSDTKSKDTKKTSGSGSGSSGSSGSSGGGSGSGSSGSRSGSDDEELKRLQDVVSLLKSELSLLEAQNAPLRQQIQKQREIQNAINNQKNYLISIGGSQEEINKLATEWYKINDEIAKLQKQMFDDLDDAIDNEIKQIEKLRDNETKVLDDQIDAIEKERDAKKKQLEYEEKIQAVEEAQANLQKAQSARTVRYYNALTGQWEWGANANDIKSAEDALTEAQDNLADYLEEKQIDDLKAQKEAIEARYEGQIDQWKQVQELLEEKGITIEEALDQIQKNGNKANAAQVAQIKALNELLGKFGYHISTSNLPSYDSGGILSGVGGIKGTSDNEVILPPDLTSKMISPVASGILNQRLNELRFLYGAGLPSGLANSIGSQYNGDIYKFGNITLSEAQARTTTVYDLAMASRNLRSYARAN